MKVHNVAIVVILNLENNKILLVQRAFDRKYWPGKWYVLSEHLRGENAKVAVMRGIREELSMVPKEFLEIGEPFEEPGELMGFPGESFRLFPFLCYPKSKEVKLNYENRDYKWHDINKIDFNVCVPRLKEHLKRFKFFKDKIS